MTYGTGDEPLVDLANAGETMDDRDWRIRLRDAEDKVKRLEIENADLTNALAREAKGHGLVYLLDQLGIRMRALEDENRSHEAFRQHDRDTIRKLGEEIMRAISGTPDEALALENNEQREEIRQWVSWAGQERNYQENMIFVLGICVGTLIREGISVPEEYTAFDNRRREGYFDLIPMPGGRIDRERPEESLIEIAKGARWRGDEDRGQVPDRDAGPFLEPGGPAAVSGGGEEAEGTAARGDREAGG
jgi:hypothetical protein